MLPLPYPPAQPDLAHFSLPPFTAGSHHWLGTDPLGRDVLVELVFGARTALGLSVAAAVLASALGALLGGTAGFWHNRLRLPWIGGAGVLGLLWWALALPGAGAGLVVAVVGLAGSGWAPARRGPSCRCRLMRQCWGPPPCWGPCRSWCSWWCWRVA
ncbi:hypothetical protein [Hymenobacter coccineus]|uniref:hypothetical protein n=1 Tax=Hymenobacter coccineus TaxID=1908235 RepID=UPI001300FE20|nr:hypothetical protein [Hymenobacter coccineus]